jgi:hypothetical protein
VISGHGRRVLPAADPVGVAHHRKKCYTSIQRSCLREKTLDFSACRPYFY